MKKSTAGKTFCVAVLAFTSTVSLMSVAGEETRVTTSAEGIRTATVSYDDLDLNTARAQGVLHYRLSHAARQVCGSVERSDAGSLAQVSKNRSCYNDAMADARRSISSGQIAVVSR